MFKTLSVITFQHLGVKTMLLTNDIMSKLATILKLGNMIFMIRITYEDA